MQISAVWLRVIFAGDYSILVCEYLLDVARIFLMIFLFAVSTGMVAFYNV